MQRLDTNVGPFFGATAPGSLQLITPLKSARKELPDPIALLQLEPAKPVAVVRTGCIPCLNEGLKCPGPRCRQRAISQAWHVNIELSPLQHGTWRERSGLHAFIDLAVTPQRMGMFRSPFWQETVMQLVLANAAVFHVASAIGALREHLMRVDSGQDGDSRTALSFGLRQCNKSIALLTQAAREGDPAYNDPGIALTVCVLFTIFEALYGDPGEALTHVQQGRKVLWNCEQNPPGFGGSSIIDATTARPVIGALQLQATCMSGLDAGDSSSPLDPLPLPDISTIYSLEHANRILHVVYSNLLLYHQHLPSYVAGAEDLSLSATQKHLRFSPWLKTWEREFAAFLFKESASLRHEDMQKAKVLKANHLLSTVLAQVDTTGGWQAWEPFTAEFKAIIDLAAAVLSTQTSSQPLGFGGFAPIPWMSFGLWISEPLFVCLSRCTELEYRRQAAGLLNGVPRPSRAKPVTKKGSLSVPSTGSRSESISRASSSSGGAYISRPPS